MGILPNDYQEVLSCKVTGNPRRVIALNVVGIFLFVVFGIIFSRLAISLGKLPSDGNFRLGLGEIGLAVAGIVLIGASSI